MPGTLRRLILGLFLAWSAFAFLAELSAALEGYDRRQSFRGDPIVWRPGTPPVATLERCMAAARERIPRGSVVVFASPPGPAQADFYRWRWAAYFLPEHDLISLSDPRAGAIGQYLISHRLPIDHPRAEPMAELPGCRLFRIRPL